MSLREDFKCGWCALRIKKGDNISPTRNKKNDGIIQQ